MRIPNLSPKGLWRQIAAAFTHLLATQGPSLRQGTGALLVSSGGDLMAGLALGFMTGTLERLPGLILLVPAAIGMRGNIFGALGSRLGTAVHTGEFAGGRPDRRSVAGQNVLASAILTVYVSIALAFLAREAARVFGVDSIGFFDYLVVSVVGGVLSSVFVLAITLAVATASVRRSWDMDNVAAPVVTAAGDIVTLPSLWLASTLVGSRWIEVGVAVLCLAALVAGPLYLRKRRDLKLARTVVRQSLPILLVAGAVDVLAGMAVDRRIEHFFTLPALFVLLPPLLEDAGALGGILSARLSSKLHLGSIAPRAIPGRAGLEDILLTFILAVPVFFLLGASATLVSQVVGLAHPGLGKMVALTMLAGVMATTGGVFVAYYSAVLSFRLGLDPDNYGIPIVTSSMDLIGTFALVLSLVILRITA